MCASSPADSERNARGRAVSLDVPSLAGGRDEPLAGQGLRIDEIIEDSRVVDWTRNPDVQNRMKQRIEDYPFELRDRSDREPTFEEIERTAERSVGFHMSEGVPWPLHA